MINQANMLPLMAFLFTSNHEGAEDVQEARNAKLALRAKLGLKDAVEKLERLQPDWVMTMGA